MSDNTARHLSLQPVQQHFERAVDTFNKINNKNIPTLYVSMAGRELNTPIEHCMNLVNTMTALNKNSFVLILSLFSASTNLIPFYKDNKCSIYSEINKGPAGNVERLKKILSTFDLSNLFFKEMIE